MTLEANNPAIEDDDLNTTAPQSKPEAWSMPAPVFRKSTGKLPQGYARETLASAVPDSSVPPSETTGEHPAPATPPPVIKPQSSFLKMVLVLLGFGAMIAFIVVFLSVLYYFFLRGEAAPPVP